MHLSAGLLSDEQLLLECDTNLDGASRPVSMGRLAGQSAAVAGHPELRADIPMYDLLKVRSQACTCEQPL